LSIRKSFIVYLKPLAAVTFWGVSFIATKKVLGELHPLELIWIRLLFAVIFLSITAAVTRQDFRLNYKDHSGILLLAIIAALHLSIQVTGLQYTSASNTGWIIGITPVFMAILGLLFFKETLSLVKTSGIIVAFFGLLLLISKGDFSNIDLISNKGDLLVLGSSFTWSVYSIVNKKVSHSYPALMTILYLFLFVVIIISPFAINSPMFVRITSLSLVSWLWIMFLGVFCSGIAYVLWAQALKEMDSVKAGAFLYFEPFVTVYAAWLILDESIYFITILSGIIITGGVILVNLKWKPSFKK
jgi:drug/metabolite transporter (DMT)-like permease